MDKSLPTLPPSLSHGLCISVSTNTMLICFLYRSKLHLVDLAGSERVAKTGAEGLVLQEAKYINSSLHHLEHVIVSLQRHSSPSPSLSANDLSRPSSRFVPYRNSLLTMVLRDSLGGNCLTSMIATISPDAMNIHETVSTCRFSQRVACISNVARWVCQESHMIVM